MSTVVQWVVESNIRDGELDNLKTLMNEMVTATEANEPDTQCYEWFISDDNKACHLYERYADSAAAMTHLNSFNEKFATRFLACLEPTRMVVYGSPTKELREAQAAFGSVHMEQIGGFAR